MAANYRTTPGGYASSLAGFGYSMFANVTSAEEFRGIFKAHQPAYFESDLVAQLRSDGLLTREQERRWRSVRDREHVINFPCLWQWLEHAAATVKVKRAKTRGD